MKFNNNINFESITNEWLLFKKPMIKKSTYYRYEYMINKYILAYFKNMHFKKLINFDFNIYTDYLNQSLSAKTSKDIIMLLKSLLKYVNNKYNAKIKLDLISSPKNIQAQVETFNDIEYKKIEKYCVDNLELKNLGIIISLNTGLRIGEICGLKWKDIDLKNNVISITKTIQRVYKSKNNTEVIIDTPKSVSSIRQIPISKKLKSNLKLYDEKYNFELDYYILSNASNYCIEPRSFQLYFKNLLKKNKISNKKFHIIRHTFASKCISLGMDIKSLSEILGHSDVNITFNKYVHSSHKQKLVYLEKL